MVLKLRCLSIPLINMLCQLYNKKDLIIIMSVILKEHHKKFGNIVEEFFTKENIRQLAHKREKILIRLI